MMQSTPPGDDGHARTLEKAPDNCALVNPGTLSNSREFNRKMLRF
ncbi:MAG TPA: hypothetical protein VNS63_12885 [Blastocatellia bacterium]|nr:hypothetical protein [Blastocatellia bacterium]